jgi:hypothetical protein
MLATHPVAPSRATTFTLETAAPRATAMDYARQLIRRDGVALRDVNFRRSPDGSIMVGAPGCVTLRFVLPGHDRR